MSANGKATEPSMDDILASIRRIIAEEPKPGTAPAARSGEPALARLGAHDRPAPSQPDSALPLPTPKPAAAWGSLGAASAAAPQLAPTPAAPTPAAQPAPLAEPASAAPPMPASPPPRPAANGSFGDDLASLIGAVRASANLSSAPSSPPTATAPPPPALDAVAQRSLNPAPVAPAAGSVPVAVPPRTASPVAAEARARGIEAALSGTAPVKPAEQAASPTSAAAAPPETAAAPIQAVAAEPIKPAPALVSAVVAKPSAAVPAAGKVAVARTMEDTVAEMLRPLLRDWLDENMPGIVEKAMKAELAEREQRKSGQKPN